jgi:hypothetical protein
MKWITREKAKVDRIACPWPISKFVDSSAEFVFLPHDTNWSEIAGGTVFDVPNAELGHHEEYCSFDAIVTHYGLEKDPALVELAKIVRAVDTPRKDWAPEGLGLEAIADGFRRISTDDFENMRRQFAVYDALYAHCPGKASALVIVGGPTSNPRRDQMRSSKVNESGRFIISAAMIAVLCVASLSRAEETAMDTGAIERLTGAKGMLDEKEGVFKVSVPRKDLSVTVAGVKMTPPMGLTSWLRSSAPAVMTWSWATWS